jgi:hypothetical protein
VSFVHVQPIGDDKIEAVSTNLVNWMGMQYVQPIHDNKRESVSTDRVD